MNNPIVNSLNGSVQRQGIKLDVRDWLDMGSPTWATTPEDQKAKAYQAATVVGWTDNGLKKLIVDTWGPRVDHDYAETTIEVLHALAKKHPAQVEVVREDTTPEPRFKLQGMENTHPFPK